VSYTPIALKLYTNSRDISITFFRPQDD